MTEKQKKKMDEAERKAIENLNLGNVKSQFGKAQEVSTREVWKYLRQLFMFGSMPNKN